MSEKPLKRVTILVSSLMARWNSCSKSECSSAMAAQKICGYSHSLAVSSESTIA
jgi:hypothetical protein